MLFLYEEGYRELCIMGCSRTLVFGLGALVYTTIFVWIHYKSTISRGTDVYSEFDKLQNEGGYSHMKYNSYNLLPHEHQKQTHWAREDTNIYKGTTDVLFFFTTSPELQTMQYEQTTMADTELFTMSTPPATTDDDDIESGATLYNYSTSITQYKLESLQAALPPLLPNYRNPCWYEELPDHFRYDLYHSAKNFTSIHRIIQSRCDRQGRHKCWRLRCFPHFFLIGAGKAGTTDLFHMLRIFHPDVATNSVKEPLFWGVLRRAHGGATYAQYLDMFDDSAELIRRKYDIVNGSTFRPIVIGDFSPNTYSCAPSWTEWPGNINQSEPLMTTPHLIYHIRPETKIIFSFREPVAKTISHYFYGPTRKYSTMNDLHKFCKNGISRFHECVAEHSVRYCVLSHSNIINRGLYYVYLQEWLSLFPPKHIFIYRFEEYITDRVKIINKISAFLDIGPVPSQYNKRITNYHPHNVNEEKVKKGPVPTAVLDMLTEFYRPWQNKMEELLRRDQRLWRGDQSIDDVTSAYNVSELIENMVK